MSRPAFSDLNPVRADEESMDELTTYRLNRLEVEVLAPARSLARPEQRLQRMISAYVALAITDPGIMALVPGDRRAPATEQPVEVRRCLRGFTDALEDDLEEIMRDQDRPTAVDSRVATQSLLGIIHWGICSHRAEDRLSGDEAAAQITFLALHGLVAGPPAHKPARPRGLNAA